MIPPCDPSILEKNPQFKKLHQHLTANLLNVDATTRAEENSPERKSIAEKLRSFQIRNVKKKIIKQALRQICFAEPVNSRSNVLSNKICETSAIIAMFLDAPSGIKEYENLNGSQLSSSEAVQIPLLNNDVLAFHDNIHLYNPVLSDTVSSWLNSLRSIADAGSSSNSSSSTSTSSIPTTAANQPRSRIRSRISNVNRKVQAPRLSTELESRISRLREIQTAELPASRRNIAITAMDLLAARGEAMERMIVLLERTKHGALSRATKAHADYLATVAECMSNKVQVTKLETLSSIYTTENKVALENYSAHLQETLKHLEEKHKIATQTLEEYDQVGANRNTTTTGSGIRPKKAIPGPMADIARRYGDLVQEVEAIQREIEKLQM